MGDVLRAGMLAASSGRGLDAVLRLLASPSWWLSVHEPLEPHGNLDAGTQAEKVLTSRDQVGGEPNALEASLDSQGRTSVTSAVELKRPLPAERWASRRLVREAFGPARAIPELPYVAPMSRRQVADGLKRLLATTRASDEVNLEETVERLSEDPSVTSLQFRREPTMERGLIVVVDDASATAPYSRDYEFFIDVCRGLVGVHRVKVIRTVLTKPEPLQPWGLSDDVDRRGRELAVVLLLTPFSQWIRGDWGDQTLEILGFARRARSMGHRVVGLVPYPVELIPVWISSLVRLVSWHDLPAHRLNTGAQR
jgi:hypothetical protein